MIQKSTRMERCWPSDPYIQLLLIHSPSVTSGERLVLWGTYARMFIECLIHTSYLSAYKTYCHLPETTQPQPPLPSTYTMQATSTSATASNCTCQKDCRYGYSSSIFMVLQASSFTWPFDSVCGPNITTGCPCERGKCICPQCPNKAHTEKVNLLSSL